MNEASCHDQAALRKELSARCRTLGVPLWFSDDSGYSADANYPELLQSPKLHDLFRTHWSTVSKAQQRGTESVTISLACSSRLVLLPSVSPAAVAPFAVALVLSTKFADKLLPATACSESGLHPDEARRQLAAFLHPSETDLDRIAAMVRWTCDDLSRGGRADKTLHQYGEQLLRSYEQINAFFQMARSISWVGDPAKLMQLVLDQLLQVLPFQWIAIRFRPGQCYATGLSGRTLLVGQPPIECAELDRLADAAFPVSAMDQASSMLLRGKSPLADAAGSDVLSEPITYNGQQIGMLLAGNKAGSDPESCEIQFLNATADLLGVFHENACRFAEQRASLLGVLQALTGAIDAKHPYTCGHSKRVAMLSKLMAGALGLGEATSERYHIAGLVHDIGKIGVPEATLCKSGGLTQEEFEIVQRHPEIGHRILSGLPRMDDVLPAVLHHHERWDGKGYPYGLSSDAIPLIARVLALADTFDAMTADRAYRAGMPRQQVLSEIVRCGGTQFDPALVPLFIKLDFSLYDQLLHADWRLAAA